MLVADDCGKVAVLAPRGQGLQGRSSRGVAVWETEAAGRADNANLWLQEGLQLNEWFAKRV